MRKLLFLILLSLSLLGCNNFSISNWTYVNLPPRHKLVSLKYLNGQYITTAIDEEGKVYIISQPASDRKNGFGGPG